ncbi:DUF5067 domain-containing protein [Listeria newyorkensis]|uniref:DUF5067 domain-containing protein n=1 Tax=Listeria newyorkensis TaxID=1497681 RepID=UPI001C89C57E|nr:DUF5067 domain-containing protein [Listeria newyorkensis]
MEDGKGNVVNLKNTLGTAGFILALIGLFTGWIPVLGWIVWVLGAVFSIIGLFKRPKGLAIAGTVISTIGVVILIIIATVGFAFGGSETKDTDDNNSTPNKVEEKETNSEEADNEPSFKGNVLKNDDIQITITSHKVIPVGQKGNEYGDKPIIAFWYDVKNISGADADPSTAWIMNIGAFQDNNANTVNELDMGPLPDDQFLSSQMESIKQGGTAKNAVAYTLDDETTPVELVYANVVSGDEYGRIKFEIK